MKTEQEINTEIGTLKEILNDDANPIYYDRYVKGEIAALEWVLNND